MNNGNYDTILGNGVDNPNADIHAENGNRQAEKQPDALREDKPKDDGYKNMAIPVNPTRNIDGNTPLIIFIGPAGCGKSMVLMSLVEYLHENGYVIKGDKGYLNTKDYNDNCQTFENILNTNAGGRDESDKLALPGSKNEILVNIFKNKSLICRMLEVPGEHFFKATVVSPTNINVTPIKAYLKKIWSKDSFRNYPVYFVFLLDLYTDNNDLKNNKTKKDKYETRLEEIFDNGYNSERGDRIILLCNKFDLTPAGFGKTTNEKCDYILKTYYNGLKGTLGSKIRYGRYKILPYISGSDFKVETDDAGNPIMVDKNYPWISYTHDQNSRASAAKLWQSIIEKKFSFF